MAATISAKQLRQSLNKAQNLGVARETFDLGGCMITVRNLRPDEYQAAIASVQELEDMEYLYEFQKQHLVRAIVELDTVSFEGVHFVETEDTDPKTHKPIKVELHQFLYDNVVSTWTKEALYVAYRKFEDAVDKAEKQAAQGITFLVPEETADEKYRRILGELREAETTLPPDLSLRILQEAGYTRQVSPAELAAANEQLKSLDTGETPEPSQEEPPVAPPPQVTTPVRPAAPLRTAHLEAPAPEVTEPEVTDPQIVIQNRVPLNRMPGVAPPMPAQRVVPNVVPTAPTQGTQAGQSAADRFAALEASVDPTLLQAGLPTAPVSLRGEDVPEINRAAHNVDAKKVMGIMDTPPVSGLNPHYRPHGRG